MVVALFLSGVLITQFPDGTDSGGVPTGEYRSTCMVRCEASPGESVYCHVAHRLAPRTGTPIDCWGHCRHAKDRPQIPLPNDGGVWRQAQTSGWCLYVRETATGRYHWPSCHAENYQMVSLRQFGPADVECDYLTLPAGVDFEYTEEPPPASSVEGAFVEPGLRYADVKRRLRGKHRRVKRGRRPGSYRVREKGAKGQ